MRPCARVLLALFAIPALAAVAVAAPRPAHPTDALAAAAPLSLPPAALAELTRKQTADERDAGAVVVYQKNSVSLAADGSSSRTTHVVLRLLRGAVAGQWDTVGTRWRPWLGARPSLRARVVTADGVAHPLDPSTIEDVAASNPQPNIYSDARALRAPLPNVVEGATIEFFIEERTRPPLDGAGAVLRLPLGGTTPMRRVIADVSAPEKAPLHSAVVALPGVTPTRTVAGGRVTLTVDRADVPPLGEPEESLPVGEATIPVLAFATAPSWGAIAARYHTELERVLASAPLPDELVRVARDAAKAANGEPRATANALLRWMRRRVRYTGLELAEASIIPRPIPTVLERGYGDCKELSTLLLAMLRAAGLPAQLTLVDTDGGATAALPGMSEFTHAIVVIPATARRPALFIDPSVDELAAGQLVSAVAGAPALVIDGTARGALITVPRAAPADNGVRFVRRYLLGASGPARVDEVSDWYGPMSILRRPTFRAASDAQRRESVERYAQTAWGGRVASSSFEGLDDPEQPVRVRMAFTDVQIAGTGTKEAGAVVNVKGMSEWLPTTLTKQPKPRTRSWRPPQPYSVEQRCEIVPPVGYAARPLPPDERFSVGGASFSLEAREQADHTVVVTTKMIFDGRTMSAADTNAAREQFAKMADHKPIVVTFDHVASAALDSGRVGEALATMRAELQREPTAQVYRERYVLALLRAGFPDAALTELDAALAKEPKSTKLRLLRAHLLTHDAVGRQYRPGADRAAAEKLLRELRAEQPKEAAPVENLYRLLVHNDEGELFGAGARLADACRESDRLRELGEEHAELDATLCLAHAGRLDEAAKIADTIKDTNERGLGVGLVAVLKEGVPAGLAKARAILEPSARGERLGHLGMQLVLLRRYPEAAQVFDEVALLSPASSPARAVAELARTVRADTPPATPTTPADVARRAAWLLATGREDAELARLFEPDMMPSRSARERMQHDLRDRFGPLPASFVADAVASRTTARVEGSERAGWHVTLDGEIRGFNVWVARRGKALKVVSPVQLVRDHLAAGRAADAAEVLLGLGGPAGDMATRLLEGKRDDLERARLAASALGLYKTAPDAIARVTTCIERGPESLRAPCAAALIVTLFENSQYKDVVARWPALSSLVSGKERASLFENYLLALVHEGAYPEIDRRLATEDPDDPRHVTLRKSLINVLRGAAQQPERVVAAASALVDGGDANSSLLNNAAWATLFLPRPDERALRWAQSAVTDSNRADAGKLNTLAALLAVHGRTDEARTVFLESVERRPSPRFGPADHFVRGLVAEGYGLTAIARVEYQRAITDGAAKDDSRLLAERALARLDAKK